MAKEKTIFGYLLLLALVVGNTSSCAQTIEVRSFSQLLEATGCDVVEIVVANDIDLCGQEVSLNNCKIFKIQGRLYNGTIVGDSTRIVSLGGSCFKSMQFKGCFNGRADVSWFDIKYGVPVDNATELNSALQLSAACTDKTLVLPKGKTIFVRSDVDSSKWRDFLRMGTVEIGSGVVFDLNGSTIRCLPNSSHQYNILFSRNTKDIVIRNGRIQGDLKEHNGDQGEWGYGIELQGVDGFLLENIECFECWGDGVDIQVSTDGDGDEFSPKTNRGHCKDGCIRNVYSHDNRRQGLSVQGIIRLNVFNSRFSGSKGTNPQCGVDIEPYTDKNIVAHAVFDSCTFDDNVNSGLLLLGKSVYDITVKKCTFYNNKGWDISLQGRNINISQCHSWNGHLNPSVRLVGDCNHIRIDSCDLMSVYAQGFTSGTSINDVIINGCTFNWGGKKTSCAFSDDKSLLKSVITFNGCTFDFSTGHFSDGNMVYQSQGLDYHYNYYGCTFDFGGSSARINSTQVFHKCIFNNCSHLFVITSNTSGEKITVKNCLINGGKSETFIQVNAPSDNLAINMDLDQTTFINNNSKKRVNISSNRPISIYLKGNSKTSNEYVANKASVSLKKIINDTGVL